MTSTTGTLLLVSATPAVESLLAATGEAFVPILYGELPDDPGPVLAQLADRPGPSVIVLDGISDPAGSLRLVAGLTTHDPSVSVILVVDHGDLALDAVRSGARDVVVRGSGPDELRAALDRAIRVARHLKPAMLAPEPTTGPTPAAATRGRIVTVVSPKGGVGKTTVATNVAVGLADRFPGATVLVDLDIQFGDVASALDLEPEYFLPDTVNGQASRDAMALKTLLTEHRTGLYVVCAPDSPIDAESVTGEQVGHLLRMLASEFSYVVVDTAPGLSEHTLAALDETSDLVLLTSMEVPGVRGLRKEIDTLNELKLLPTDRQVVINFADPHSLLSIADIEATIRARVEHQLPRSKAAVDAVNQGVPLLESGARDPLTKQLRALVDRIVAAGPGTTVPEQVVELRQDRADKSRPRRAASRWSRTRQLVAR